MPSADVVRAWTLAAAEDDVETLQRLLHNQLASASSSSSSPSLVDALHPEHERTALQLAAAWNAARSARFLLKHGANEALVAADGNTAIHIATEQDADASLQVILEHITDKRDTAHAVALLNYRDRFGYTALHTAATVGAVSCCRRLLGSGYVDTHLTVDTPGRAAVTALDLALQGQHHGIVSMLQQRWPRPS